VSAATLRLRSPIYAGVVKPATFVAPLGPVVPMAAILVSAAIAAGATREQFIGGLAALLAGAALFVSTSYRRDRAHREKCNHEAHESHETHETPKHS